MNIWVINGKPRSGKDTFCDFCAMNHPYVNAISTVDFVKDIAKSCGWSGEKDLKNRKFLSDLKDLLTNWNDVPYQQVLKRISVYENTLISYGIDTSRAVIFIHCREPEEIQRFRRELKANALLIRRPDCDQEASNHADEEVEKDLSIYDLLIENNGTLEELNKESKRFLGAIGVLS